MLHATRAAWFKVVERQPRAFSSVDRRVRKSQPLSTPSTFGAGRGAQKQQEQAASEAAWGSPRAAARGEYARPSHETPASGDEASRAWDAQAGQKPPAAAPPKGSRRSRFQLKPPVAATLSRSPQSDPAAEGAQRRFERPSALRVDAVGEDAMDAELAAAARAEREDAATGQVRMAPQEVGGIFDEGPQLSRKAERRRMMEAALDVGEAEELSIHAGGEADIDHGGMPPDAYHAAPHRTAVAGDSALNQSILSPKRELESRQGRNSWNTLPRGEPSMIGGTVEDEVRSRSTPRDWHASEGHYQADFSDATMLEHQLEAVQYSRSIYTKRRLMLDGLCAYHGFCTAAEERDICGELLVLLSEPGTVRYHPEECRYCVNLYEHRLGVQTQEAPLAFAMSKAPTLARVLLRAFQAGLVPAPPNVVQVSEFVGPWAYYPAQRKSRALGPYYGVLNLVSRGVMNFVHADQPWAPQVLALPRALYVVEDPVLHDFRVGYIPPQHTIRTFQDSSRHTRDYRIEVAFACVDVETLPLLRDAAHMTEYSRQRLLQAKAGGAELPPGTTERLDDSVMRPHLDE